jgi:hypothetical protein
MATRTAVLTWCSDIPAPRPASEREIKWGVPSFCFVAFCGRASSVFSCSPQRLTARARIRIASWGGSVGLAVGATPSNPQINRKASAGFCPNQRSAAGMECFQREHDWDSG